MLTAAIGVILLAHGVGHVLGLLPIIGFAPTAALPDWTGRSWILASAPVTVGQLISAALWFAALVGFVALSFVVFGWLPMSWWRPLAVGSSLVSLAAIALFPAGFPTIVNIVGAAVVDVVVLAATVVYDWDPSMI